MSVVFSPGVIEIAVIQTVSGRPAVNVWHLRHDEEFASPETQAVVEDFRDNWQDHVLLCVSASVALLRFEYRSLDPADSTVGVVEPDPLKNLVGQESLPAAPPNVALLVKKNTGARPRGRRDGRSFLPGPNEGVIGNDGVLDPGFVAGCDAALADFYDGISDSSLDWTGDVYPVVLETTPASRAPGTASVTIGSRRVNSITMDPLVSTQRDRLR